MSDDKSMEEHYAEMDYTAHNNTFGRFIGLVKWGTILSVIAAIVAIWAIT